MTWTKLQPFSGPVHRGCLNCSHVYDVAPMDLVISVGFGCAEVTRDEIVIFSDRMADDADHALSEFEALAAADPDHDWRVVLYGPLHGEVYQRHETGRWVLVESNAGFA